MHHFVYYVFCSLTGALLYIGRSHRPERRRREHQVRLDRPLRLGPMQRYKDFERACSAEREAIRKHNPPLNKRERRRQSLMGHPVTNETRSKMSASQQARRLRERANANQ